MIRARAGISYAPTEAMDEGHPGLACAAGTFAGERDVLPDARRSERYEKVQYLLASTSSSW
jgi:hypothetical protein